MNRLLSLSMAALLAFGLAACGGEEDKSSSDTSSTPVETPKEYSELLFDKNFAEGIDISSLQSQQVAYTPWRYGTPTADEPYWNLGQYGDLSTTRNGYDSSVNDLFPGNIFEDPKGISGTDGDYYTLTNQSGSKYMSVNPSVGEVNLNIDSSKEYIDQSTGALQPRREGEDWIHMILSQTAGVVYLDEVDELIMELDFTLTECEIYDNSIGAAQFQWIFSVHDKASSAMEKEYFWFNVTLFDNRYEIFPGTQMFDGGKADATGKFIFAPTGQQLFGESGGKVEVGTTYHIRLNLKEYMQNAFNIAKEKGALKNSSWENMAVNGFNIGWEVSNVSKVGVKISNMSLKTK
ncbi:MAG: hypothetical protein IJF44_01675 [Clostridia bacterium]|nr:hypothetical protein [Clostridia bacterium]